MLDIGGDDRGALALGRYVPEIRAEGNYEMLFVINRARPLTRTVEDTDPCAAGNRGRLRPAVHGIVNNTNLGQATAAVDVLSSMPYAEAVAARAGLPLKMTCCAAAALRRAAREHPEPVPDGAFRNYTINYDNWEVVKWQN